MIRYLAVIGTLAAFVGAPAMAQQPAQKMHKSGSVSKGASAYAPAPRIQTFVPSGIRADTGLPITSALTGRDLHIGHDHK
jgi:hypothetical protein